MSVFSPSARTTSPDGREWEIYAYKIQLPARDGSPGIRTDDFPLDPIADVVSIGYRTWRGLVRSLQRLLIDVPVASVRALRSDEWTIQAIAWVPQKQTYTWTTTREFRGQVLAQVEGHLTRGDVPHHLTNATYRGFG